MASETFIKVQVCHVNARRQFLKTIQLPAGSTLQQAIELSGLMEELEPVLLGELKVGIYSRPRSLDTILKDRDRIEIYRPLQIDPMMARRKRAVKRAGKT